MKTKVCTKCGESKGLGEYYKHKYQKSGLRSQCKICTNKSTKRYAQENKEKVAKKNKDWYERTIIERKKSSQKYRNKNIEKILRRNKKYRQENKNKIQESNNKYRAKNKEKISEKAKEYREKNKEKKAIQQRKWAQNNPEKNKAKDHKRRAAKAGNGGSFTAKEWKDLCEKYDNKCLCCGTKKKLEADHVIPVSWEGGRSNIGNIQPLCRSCNASKGNHHATDYRVNYTEAKAKRSNNET